MRILSFNVNGMKSLHAKSKTGDKNCPLETNCLNRLILEQTPDIVCLQEIRCQTTKELDAYKTSMPYLATSHSTVRKGYSGTAILSRRSPLQTTEGFARFPDCVPEDKRSLDLFAEGRMLTAEYETFWVVCVYTPNAKDALARLPERLLWDTCFQTYLNRLQATGKTVVTCGDFNCALADVDIFNPKAHRKSAGFSDEERHSFQQMLTNCELVDTYRVKNPTTVKYSYWSNFFKSREKNRGWRIDYVLVGSHRLDAIVHADILNEYYGSDHCPVLAEITL